MGEQNSEITIETNPPGFKDKKGVWKKNNWWNAIKTNNSVRSKKYFITHEKEIFYFFLTWRHYI